MFFITISEMMGTEGEKIAIQVAESMGYSFWGEKELLSVAKEMGFFSDLLIAEMEEKGPSWTKQLLSNQPKIALGRLQSVIYNAAMKGSGVFFGAGSQLLFRSFDCALHVLLVGSTEKRISLVMEENHLDKEAAEKVVVRSHHDKEEFYRFAYHEDWSNPTLYDLVLDIDKLSIDFILKTIVDAAKAHEKKPCRNDAEKTLEKLSLLLRVESDFLEADVSKHVHVKMEEKGCVCVYGYVQSNDEKEEVTELLKKNQEINSIKNDLVVVRAGGF
jgi:cytidylate kinase